MSETQALLERIATLRQRLEHAADNPLDGSQPGNAPGLTRQLHLGWQWSCLLDQAVRPLAGEPPAGPLPGLMTARARACLERGRDLLARLRQGTDALARGCSRPEDGAIAGEEDLLSSSFQQAVAMTDVAVRMLSAMPDTAGGQLRICPGVEAILDAAQSRAELVEGALARRLRNEAYQERLADLLTHADGGRLDGPGSFIALAEELAAEAQQGGLLQAIPAPFSGPARFAATHGLAVARVAARLVNRHPDFRKEPLRPIVAALLHDVGMLRVPPAVLNTPGPLDTEGQRVIEAHPRTGAEAVRQLAPMEGWLAEATANHHERLDGTGYPAGRRAEQLDPLVSFLAVCDVYVAMSASRPHRPAKEPRTALTDTLLMAEAGALDARQAERLLEFSFYPAGSVVELTDGLVALVIATMPGSLGALARPVVAILTDPTGRALATPEFADLARCDGREILRLVPPAERRRVLGVRYPHLAA